EDNVRLMGRTAYGVRGIALEGDDEVVSVDVLSPGRSILTVSEKGQGKRSDLDEYRVQSRGGKGIITMKLSEKTGAVVGTVQVADDDEVMMVTDRGRLIRLRVGDIRVIGRNTQGVRLLDVDEGERVVAVARVVDKGEIGEGSAGEGSAEEGSAEDAGPEVTA
ncbi:MAG: DNA gyrase C-terminal beta-propeller domain-containing protein, partial [Alphaproteobacteria bacterium]